MSDPAVPQTTACAHPPASVSPGPRIPRVYGTGPTEICACGSWRPAWYPNAVWHPADELVEAMEEDDER